MARVFDLAEDEHFTDARSRMKNCQALISELDAVFASKTVAEWADRFDEHDVWWAPIQSIVDVMLQAVRRASISHMSERPFRVLGLMVGNWYSLAQGTTSGGNDVIRSRSDDLIRSFGDGDRSFGVLSGRGKERRARSSLPGCLQNR